MQHPTKNSELPISKRLDFLLDLVWEGSAIIIAGYLIYLQLWGNPKPDVSTLLTGVLGILGLVSVDLLIARYRRLSNIDNKLDQAIGILEDHVVEKVRASEFFDEAAQPTVADFNNAEAIYISGITLGSTIQKFAYELGNRTSDEIPIKILLIESEDHTINQVIKRSWGETDTEFYKTRLANTLTQINILRQSKDGASNIEIKRTPYVPSFGLVLIEYPADKGKAFIEIYTHHTSKPFPKFAIDKTLDDRWYQEFKEQFDLIWKNSSEESVAP